MARADAAIEAVRALCEELEAQGVAFDLRDKVEGRLRSLAKTHHLPDDLHDAANIIQVPRD